MPTAAHRRAAFAVVDPCYAADRVLPAPDAQAADERWLYGPEELACFLLQRLRRQVADAKLKAMYPGDFHTPAKRVFFRHRRAEGALVVWAAGAVTARIGDRVVYQGPDRNNEHVIPLPDHGDSEWIVLAIEAPGDLPGLRVDTGPFADVKDWTWSVDAANWQCPAMVAATVRGEAPHRAKPVETPVHPLTREGDLFDFGRELLGTVTVRAAARPVIGVGESRAEALNTAAEHFEQSTEMIAAGDGAWRSAHPLALRYLRAPDADEVVCAAHFPPARYAGAFACSDETLTRVAHHAAYTLRLCMGDFLLDGIKRDRLPWVGDLAMSLLVNAHVFRDAVIVRRTLTALGRAGTARVPLNGIVDYSLWWVIAHDYFQRYFAEPDYLREAWPRILDLMTRLESRADAQGLLATAPGDWIFIDWVKDEKATALQMLWYWALQAAARLADRVTEKEAAARWRGRAARLADTLRHRA